jgi:hypothetical protein
MARDDALVVADDGEVTPGIAAQTRLAMIEVGTQQFYVVNELMVQSKRHDVVTRVAVAGRRKWGKPRARRCTECQPVAGLNAGPASIGEGDIRKSL